MKKTILILGVAAFAVAMASCNKDEIKKIDSPTFDGDRAYCVVTINDVNSPSTRATANGYEYGSTNEYAVNDAHFYFYDQYGEYVTEASAGALSGTPSSAEPATSIEWGSSSVITLEGLSSKNYPSWVVTVVNRPDGFSAPGELADFEGLLASADEVGIGDATSGLTMSTSSFAPDADDEYYSSTYYFATPVAEENFSTEPLTEDENADSGYVDKDGAAAVPIVIHVERLAAKVRLAMEATGTEVGGYTLYPIEVEMIDEEEGTPADTTLYVRINGWGLNGTAKSSNMVKTIDPAAWGDDDAALGFAWNDPDNFRSYWGESFNYGLGLPGDYPTSATDGTYDITNGGYYDGDSYSEWLEYRSWNDLGSAIGGEIYCAENTNTAGQPANGIIVTSPQSSAITNILVSATICDAEGNGLDLVRHDGVLYTEDDFLAYAMGHNTALYYMTDTVNVTYELCGPDYAELVNGYDGHVYVYFKEDYAEDTFYTVAYNEEQEQWEVTATYDYEAANGYLDQRFNNLYSSDANAYAGGDMYYNIPVQHLNDDYEETYTGEDDEDHTLVLEGNYGIVRNHVYAVTITGVESLGRGVFDPDEIIIPQIDEDTYTLLAQINILSWRVVEQGVTL